MEKLDEKSAADFIGALVKSVQALCHGYLDFHNGIEIIGHINLSVDKESSLHYILEEKVCKSEENSTMFISNSFYAQNQKMEPQTKETSSGNVSPRNKTVHKTDPADFSVISKLSSVVSCIGSSLSTSSEKSPSGPTSSASEADSSPLKTVSSTAKRKASGDGDSVKTKTKALHFSSGRVVRLASHSPHSLVDISSLEDAKPSLREFQGEDNLPEDSLLPQAVGTSGDIAISDIGVSLAGSVLEPVGEHSNSDHAGRQDDSDGDLEVTFIKKEFVDEEQSTCLSENSGVHQYGRETHHRASTSKAMPDSSVYPVAHHHSAGVSATYVPSAHSLDISSAQLYGPSTASSQSHQETYGTGSRGQKGVEGQLGHSSHMGFMIGEASYTPPLAHHAHSSVAYPALGLSVLDLSIKTEPRDPDFVLFNCEQRRKKNSLDLHTCAGPRSEESRQKAKERSKEYRLKQKIHRMTDSTYDMIFRHQVAERKRRQRMRERIKKLKVHGVAGYSIAK